MLYIYFMTEHTNTDSIVSLLYLPFRYLATPAYCYAPLVQGCAARRRRRVARNHQVKAPLPHKAKSAFPGSGKGFPPTQPVLSGSVAAGSVAITATIDVPSSTTTSAVKSSLSSSLGSGDASGSRTHPSPTGTYKPCLSSGGCQSAGLACCVLSLSETETAGTRISQREWFEQARVTNPCQLELPCSQPLGLFPFQAARPPRHKVVCL